MQNGLKEKINDQITDIVETKTSYTKRFFILLIAILLIVSGIFFFLEFKKGNFNDIQSFKSYIQSYGFYGPLILGIFQTVKVIFAVIPCTLGYIVGPGLFGTVTGFICNYIGICAGSIIAFCFSRKFGVKLVKQIFSQKRYDKCIKWMEKRRISFALLLWLALLIPFSPDDFLCYFAGLTDLKFKKFVLVILTAKPWIIIFYSIVFGKIFN